MIKYILMFLIGGGLSSILGLFDGGNSISIDSPKQLIALISFIIAGIGFYGGIIHLWFKLLKMFYPKADIHRLWRVTGYIIWIIITIALCFTGVGAISLVMIKHPVRGLVPKEIDR